MTIWNIAKSFALVALLGVGCGSSDAPAAKGPAASSAPPPEVKAERVNNFNPKEAQPKLQTLKLWLGAEEMIAEIAASQKEIMTGMMHRTSMAENEGMLFVFPYPHQTAFYMRNTILPLSCAYIDPDGTILELHDMTPQDETPIQAATARIQYVLETKQGWFARHNVSTGAVVRTERGTLAQTFFRRQ